MNEIDKLFKFKPSGIEARKGCILISEPFLSGLFFERSVVLLAEHNNDGAFGLILNKKSSVKISSLFEEFKGFDADVFIGGPVESGNIFFLHNRNDIISESEKIIDGVHWGGNFDELKTALINGLIALNEVRFYLGYSGWSQDQLRDELNQYSWLVSKIDSKRVFTEKPSDLWRNVVAEFGDEFKYWLNLPSDPKFN